MTPDVPRYEEIEGWEKNPADVVHRDVADVAVDSADVVYALTRHDHLVCIYDRDGHFVRSWGRGVLGEGCHGITVAPDSTVYLTDYLEHTVSHFTGDGELLRVVGTPGVGSDTGIDRSLPYPQRLDSISRPQPAPPFHGCTKVAIAPDGDIYVSDGYYNARIHHFTPDFELVHSWGEAGGEPGQFRNPHSLHIAPDGRLFVADRENERVQIFDLDGNLLDIWKTQRPCAMALDPDGRLCVTELDYNPGDFAFTRGTVASQVPGHLSIFAADGTIVGGIGADGPPFGQGVLTAPNGVAVDSRGDVYVAEARYAFYNTQMSVPDHTPIRKFARVRD
jgi:hypothetical protein